jgi:hypothetical protein
MRNVGAFMARNLGSILDAIGSQAFGVRASVSWRLELSL